MGMPQLDWKTVQSNQLEEPQQQVHLEIMRKKNIQQSLQKSPVGGWEQMHTNPFLNAFLSCMIYQIK